MRCKKQGRKETNVLNKQRNSDKVYNHHIKSFLNKNRIALSRKTWKTQQCKEISNWQEV